MGYADRTESPIVPQLSHMTEDRRAEVVVEIRNNSSSQMGQWQWLRSVTVKGESSCP